MAKILRCPVCGALWRLPSEDDAGEKLKCGECGTIFSLDKAETLDVEDRLLEERLRSADAQKPEEDHEARMAAIADDISDFSPARAESETRGGSAAATLLKALLGLFAVCVLLSAAALMGHAAVLDSFPPLRGVYQSVCGKLPCPGFVWVDPKAVRAEARLIADGAQSVPTVELILTNASDHPVHMPMIEVKLLNAAGDAIMQRLLEPADYGYPQQPAVLAAGDRTSALIRITTPVPYPPSNVAVTPVENF